MIRCKFCRKTLFLLTYRRCFWCVKRFGRYPDSVIHYVSVRKMYINFSDIQTRSKEGREWEKSKSWPSTKSVQNLLSYRTDYKKSNIPNSVWNISLPTLEFSSLSFGFIEQNDLRSASLSNIPCWNRRFFLMWFLTLLRLYLRNKYTRTNIF